MIFLVLIKKEISPCEPTLTDADREEPQPIGDTDSLLHATVTIVIVTVHHQRLWWTPRHLSSACLNHLNHLSKTVEPDVVSTSAPPWTPGGFTSDTQTLCQLPPYFSDISANIWVNFRNLFMKECRLFYGHKCGLSSIFVFEVDVTIKIKQISYCDLEWRDTCVRVTISKYDSW